METSTSRLRPWTGKGLAGRRVTRTRFLLAFPGQPSDSDRRAAL